MEKHDQQLTGARLWIGLVLRMSLFAVMLMWPAGTWRWMEAWLLSGLWFLFSVTVIIFLADHDPELLRERLKLTPVQKEQPYWDKVLMVFFYAAGLGIYIVPGLDVMRYGWSEPFSLWVRIMAMLVHLPCYLFLIWVMKANTYLSPVVKIDEKRGHSVVTTGPYRFVRHPMYSAVIILLFAVPVALGSRFALIPAFLLAILLVLRTYFEDRTLYRELPGYPEYTQKTTYRLLPGIW